MLMIFFFFANGVCHSVLQVHYLQQRVRVSFRHVVELVVNSVYVHGDIFVLIYCISLTTEEAVRTYQFIYLLMMIAVCLVCRTNIHLVRFCLIFILFIRLAGGYKTASLITKTKAAAFTADCPPNEGSKRFQISFRCLFFFFPINRLFPSLKTKM